MASPDEHTLTFLRGTGFLLGLVGAWDLMADEGGPWPAQKGFMIFKETTVIAVIERHPGMRRGIEGTYAVEGNRLRLQGLRVDTAPERGVPDDMEFVLDGDLLTVTWLPAQPTCHTPQVDRFRRRAQSADGALLPPVEIYESDVPKAPAR